MKSLLVNGLAASALVISAASAVADDELIVYVFNDGTAASGYTIKLDGEVEQQVTETGSAVFDLSAGVHSLQLLDPNGNRVHTFRFDSASGQLTDINMLVEDDDVNVAVESFFPVESAKDKMEAPRGVLQGVVTTSGVPIAGARVSVDDTDNSVSTEDDGSYEIELPRGIYDLTVTHPDYTDTNAFEVRVVSNVTKGLNFKLRSANAPAVVIQNPIEEVLTLGTFNSNAFELDERFAPNVVDSMDIEQIARFGDSDISASVVRMPSVTIQEDSFIFIRGLGGRYVTSTLNGATMPSTNPNKRTVPLDLFPSNIVQQLDVKKTFNAAMPAESTGGNLVINTRTFPEERAGKLSFKVGYNNAITGEEVYTDSLDGDFDALGWDDGTRREPAAVEAIALVLNPALAIGVDDDGNIERYFNLDDKVVQELSRTAAFFLDEGLDLDTATAEPNFSLGLNYGDLFYAGDGEIGFFLAGNYKSGWKAQEDGERNTYSPTGEQRNDFEFVQHTHVVEASGLMSLGYVIGDHTFEANTIASRVTESEVYVEEGLDGDSSEQVFGYSVEWEERQYLSQQLVGEHVFDYVTVDWQGTYSQATRYAPDLRLVQFNQETAGVWSLQIPDLVRRYDDLVDNNVDLSSDIEWEMRDEQTLNFGGKYIFRDRESDSASYGYRFGALVQNPGFNDAPNRLVADVINEDNITGDSNTGLAFDDKTLLSDSYSADMTLSAAYLSYDATFADKYQFILGARYEDYEQTTDTFNIQTRDSVKSLLEDQDVFESAAFNWLYSDSQQVRFAYSETASRPDFKETSNSVFYDRGVRERGNPLLNVSKVTNFDIRWESYFRDADNFSVALFYKEFQDPIERVVQPASGTAGNSRTYQNSPDATLEGIEIDGRMEFGLNSDLTQTIFVQGNLSWIESEVTLDGGATRALQGQPEYTFNLILGWDDLNSDQELTLLFNQNGKSIDDVGINGAPDVFEEPFADLKLNYKKQFGEDFTFSMKFSNILDSDVELTQGGQLFERYNKGVEAEAGIDWKF